MRRTRSKTSVMKDLLGRSAKATGDYYGEQVEEFFNKRRERRRKNVRDHEQQVEQITGAPVDILAEGDRGAAIERWVTVAADVPLEDAERAAFVEAILAEILTSNRSSEFQDVAERLSGPSMRIFLNAPSDRKFLPGGDDRGNFETLRELGLARKPDLAGFLLLLLAWCVGTAAGLYLLTRILPPFLPTTMSIGFVYWRGLLSAASFLPLVWFFSQYELHAELSSARSFKLPRYASTRQERS